MSVRSQFGQFAIERLGRMSNKSWTEYYMGFALHAATKSKDPNTKVGAILVGPNGEVRLSGYNGPPSGVKDLPERLERPLKYMYVNHAEAGLISFAARNGISTDGCCVVTSHLPCASCARLLIQAGIKHIIYGSGQTNMPEEEFIAARQMLSEAGVSVEEYRDG
jgi:dCMP deaminase